MLSDIIISYKSKKRSIMDDLERYGDYNEVDEPPKKSPVLTVIKIIAAVIIIAIVGLLGFRLFLFNYTPKDVSTLYFTENLTEYYNSTGGNIGALAQKLRAPYDDAELGNFFCDNVIVIPGCGEIQLSLRYNASVGKNFLSEYGFDGFDPDDSEQFSFRLWRDGKDDEDEGYEVGKLVAAEWSSFSMYRYFKLVFDGIDFDGETSEDKIEWIRLEIFVDGVEKDTPFMVPIYENNEGYSKFEKYVPSKGERP